MKSDLNEIIENPRSFSDLGFTEEDFKNTGLVTEGYTLQDDIEVLSKALDKHNAEVAKAVESFVDYLRCIQNDGDFIFSGKKVTVEYAVSSVLDSFCSFGMLDKKGTPNYQDCSPIDFFLAIYEAISSELKEANPNLSEIDFRSEPFISKFIERIKALPIPED